MNAPALGVGRNLRAVIDGLAQHVKHASQGDVAHRDGDGVAGGGDGHIPGQALGAVQQDAADHVSAHMPGHFHEQRSPLHLNGQGLFDAGEVVAVEGDIHDRTDDLRDFSLFHGTSCYSCAAAPETTSVISVVMAA